MFSIDLILGNDDRHWNNWLIQQTEDEHGIVKYRLRAMDFSRSWPVRHPCQHPLKHQHPNTWRAAKEWELLGVNFDLHTFYKTCVTISSLPASWLRSTVLAPLTGVFLSSAQIDEYSQWWQSGIHTQAIDAIHALENGVRP